MLLFDVSCSPRACWLGAHHARVVLSACLLAGGASRPCRALRVLAGWGHITPVSCSPPCLLVGGASRPCRALRVLAGWGHITSVSCTPRACWLGAHHVRVVLFACLLAGGASRPCRALRVFTKKNAIHVHLNEFRFSLAGVASKVIRKPAPL